MFLFSCQQFLEELEKFSPNTLNACEQALNKRSDDLVFLSSRHGCIYFLHFLSFVNQRSLRDADALATVIARIDDDSELAAKIGQAAKTKALQEFDERIVIEQTLAVYDELL